MAFQQGYKFKYMRWAIGIWIEWSKNWSNWIYEKFFRRRKFPSMRSTRWSRTPGRRHWSDFLPLFVNPVRPVFRPLHRLPIPISIRNHKNGFREAPLNGSLPYPKNHNEEPSPTHPPNLPTGCNLIRFPTPARTCLSSLYRNNATYTRVQPPWHRTQPYRHRPYWGYAHAPIGRQWLSAVFTKWQGLDGWTRQGQGMALSRWSEVAYRNCSSFKESKKPQECWNDVFVSPFWSLPSSRMFYQNHVYKEQLALAEFN
jgi:hypothetical protein